MNPIYLRRLGISLAIALLSETAFAQQHEHSSGDAHVMPATLPVANYAGQQLRQIKALSPQEQQDWLDGKGLGMAKAAELNGYPGPMHTLEYALALNLTDEQRQKTQALLHQHKAAVKELGALLVAEEKLLDRQFASADVTPDQISIRTARIAALQGQIRAEHLRTHLAQKALLSTAQIALYQTLRGYAQ